MIRQAPFVSCVGTPYPLMRETMGPPRFLASLFLRATLSDPGRPSRISPVTILLCWLPVC